MQTLGYGLGTQAEGNCYVNAVAESFVQTLKSELIYHERYQTAHEVRQSVFEYIEVFYNRLRFS